MMSGGHEVATRAWRLIQVPFVRVFVALVWYIAFIVSAQLALRRMPARKTPAGSLVAAVIIIAVAYLAYRAYVHVIEKRPLQELNGRGALAEFGRGFAIGALMFTMTIAIEWSFGYYAVIGINRWTIALPATALAMSSGVIEEIFFRGIVFRILEESLGTWVSLSASALLFGFLHLLNPSATLIAAISIALEAGALLAAAYVLTRRLWLPIAIHIAWNFMEGAVFGVAVSGGRANGILQSRVAGPELITGGAFGPEASLISILLGLIVVPIFVWRAHDKGHFVRPFWLRRDDIAPHRAAAAQVPAV